MRNQRMLNSLFTAAALAALTACGGGGGGGTATLAPAPAADPGTSSIVASVPAPSYAGGSQELIAFNTANDQRGACGFGRLAQSTQLDAAAKDHADWMLINNQYSHTQSGTSFPNGFTGDTPTARATFRGFTGTVAEALTRFETDDLAGVGEVAARQLLSGPYHGQLLLSGQVLVGVAVRNSTAVGAVVTGTQRIAVELGASGATQQPGVSEILTYPCEGSTGLFRMLTGETPNPIPGRDLSVNPIGHPIFVQGRESATVRITAATMTVVGPGTGVTLRTPVDSSNDPNMLLPKNVAYVAPDAALAANTTYRVQISGTRDGVPFTKDFNFATGNLI